jgi:hypothetical protein
MSLQEINRLTNDLNTNAKLRDQLKVLGHDTGAFVDVANRLGYKFTQDDLNQYIIQKQASLSREKAAQLATAASSTVAVTKTAAVAVTTAVGVTKVGGAVIAVEVAVLT